MWFCRNQRIVVNDAGWNADTVQDSPNCSVKASRSIDFYPGLGQRVVGSGEQQSASSPAWEMVAAGAARSYNHEGGQFVGCEICHIQTHFVSNLGHYQRKASHCVHQHVALWYSCSHEMNILPYSISSTLAVLCVVILAAFMAPPTYILSHPFLCSVRQSLPESPA